MAKVPKVDFYPGDFLVGCTDLTMEERGQYITLLCVQHQKGRLSRKAIQLAIGINADKISPDVMTKFIVDAEGLFYNERMEFEMIKYSKFIQHQKDNSQKRWPPKNNKPPSNDPMGHPMGHPKGYPKGYPKPIPLDKDKDKDNSSSSSLEEFEGTFLTSFDEFWQIYDRDEDRILCETVWMQMEESERRECMKVIREYVASTPDKEYRRNPHKYLKTKSWKNEIIIKNGNNKKSIGASVDEIASLVARKFGSNSRK